MTHRRSLLPRAMLAAGAALFLATPVNANAADTSSVQQYLERLLGGSAPADLGVLQQDLKTFRVRVKTSLLFRAFQLEPTSSISPRLADLTAKNLGDGRWGFEGSSSRFKSSNDDEIWGIRRQTSANAARAELKGLFDPARGASNRMDLTYFDGRYVAKYGESTYNAAYQSAAFFLEETTGKDRWSRSNVGLSLGGLAFDFQDESGTGQMISRNFAYSIEADGLNYRSLKDQIRMGERISLHSAEGDLDYPRKSTAAMRDFKLRLAATDITATEGVEGERASAFELIFSGKVPSDKARSNFTLDARDLEYVGPRARRFYLPFIPADLTAKGHVSGFDFRKLYLRSNILSNISGTPDDAFLDNNFTPNGKVALSGIEGSLVHDATRMDFRGEMVIDFAALSVSAMKLEVRSNDIDKIIADNTERARRDPVAGSLQFALFFLKGAARHEGATSVWMVEFKNGKAKINDADFSRY